MQNEKTKPDSLSTVARGSQWQTGISRNDLSFFKRLLEPRNFRTSMRISTCWCQKPLGSHWRWSRSLELGLHAAGSSDLSLRLLCTFPQMYTKESLAPLSSCSFKIDEDLCVYAFYMYECFACTYVYVQRICLVPKRPDWR